MKAAPLALNRYPYYCNLSRGLLNSFDNLALGVRAIAERSFRNSGSAEGSLGKARSRPIPRKGGTLLPTKA